MGHMKRSDDGRRKDFKKWRWLRCVTSSMILCKPVGLYASTKNMAEIELLSAQIEMWDSLKGFPNIFMRIPNELVQTFLLVDELMLDWWEAGTGVYQRGESRISPTLFCTLLWNTDKIIYWEFVCMIANRFLYIGVLCKQMFLLWEVIHIDVFGAHSLSICFCLVLGDANLVLSSCKCNSDGLLFDHEQSLTDT